MTGSERGVRRVRHELKLRLLQVSQVERITPGFVRVTLTGEDLAGYSSQGYDDHSKLFFPAPGEDKPLFLSSCGKMSAVYKPSRWSRLVGALLAPISGQTLSQTGGGARNI